PLPVLVSVLGALISGLLAVMVNVALTSRQRLQATLRARASLEQEISERERAVKAMRDSERRYRRYVERNAAGFLCSTLDGRLVECNDVILRLLGFESRRELMSRRVPEIYCNSADRQRILDRLMEHKSLTGCEICLKRKDGAPLWALVNMTLVEGDEGWQIE